MERRALKQARFAFKKKQFVFNVGCCKDVKSKSKVQANRVAELEIMIGLRTSAVPMLMNEPFMPPRQ